MRTIAIINQKGGCGKTTVSINLAATLAAQGQRTLLVDMDPQAHCALGLSVPSAQIERGAAELLRHGLDGSLTMADVTWQAAAGLDLVPSTMALAGIEPELREAPDRDRRLVQVLATASDRYDFCIIDCPPSIGLLTFNALRAADEVIVPVETGYFAMQGSIRQEQTIQMLARRVGHHVRLSVLPTMHDDEARLSRELLAEIHRQFSQRVLPTTIHFSGKLKEAASFGQPIGEYDDKSTAARDFAALAGWLTFHTPTPAESTAANTRDAAETETLSSSQRHALAMHGSDHSEAWNEPGQRAAGQAANGSEPGSRFDPHPREYASTSWEGEGWGGATDASANPSDWSPAASATSTAGATLGEPFGDRGGSATAHAEAQAPPRADHGGHASGTTPSPSPPKRALSRAAELVERARALSARSAQIADRLGTGSTTTAEPPPTPSVPTSVPTEDPATLSEHPFTYPSTVNAGPSAEPANPSSQTNPNRFARLFGARSTARGVLFVQPMDHAGIGPLSQASSVSVAGDFNDWTPASTPLRRNHELGLWQACVQLPPGRYGYRLVVDGHWLADPHNQSTDVDRAGETTSRVEVSA